jgi:hypothetical protein
MSKKAVLPQSRHHILIYDEDWAWLELHYGPGGAKAELGISGAIRAIIHQRVLGMKAVANKTLDGRALSGSSDGEKL